MLKLAWVQTRGIIFKIFISCIHKTQLAKITPQLIQQYFANTIFPLANITTEPLTTNTQWWKEVEQDGEESPAEYFQPWHKMMDWFAAQHDFIDCAFVRIGDSALLEPNQFG